MPIRLFQGTCDSERIFMKILANPDFAKNLGDNAGVVYQNYYTEDRMLNEYAQLHIFIMGVSMIICLLFDL